MQILFRTRRRPTLLGMPDIKWLSILRITYEVISNPHESRKLDVQTIEWSTSPETEKEGTHDNNTNILD